MRSFSIDSRVRAGTCEALPIASVGQVVASNTENVTIEVELRSCARSEDTAWRAADAGSVAQAVSRGRSLASR